MKRIGFLHEKICSYENIVLAHKNASRGKSGYRDVIKVEENPQKYLTEIEGSLKVLTFRTSKYIEQKINDGNKDRIIHKLPYFPDRIVHHALMQIVYPIFTNCLIRNTFQSIQGRGVFDCRSRITEYISKNNPKYFIKVDIRKFFPSVDKEILKIKLRTKIKCESTLSLLDEIVDSGPEGLPIGNYTSQIFGNFYLSDLDWKIVQNFKVGYFRYCDDILILTDSREDIPGIITALKDALQEIHLTPKYIKTGTIKDGILFAGYRFNIDLTRLSKKIIKRVNSAIDKNSLASLISYKGLLINIDNKDLLASVKETTERLK